MSNPWATYDAWEARDRTLLEAVAIARERQTEYDRERAQRTGYLRYLEYGTHQRVTRPFLAPALDSVRAERYRSSSPDPRT